MARLPPRGAPDPVTDKYKAALLDAVADSFWLPNEKVIHAGRAQHEATGVMYGGRGEGEGILFLTTERFIFWFDKVYRSQFIAIPKDKVRGVRAGSNIMPGWRTLSLRMDNAPPTIANRRGQARFYAGRPLAQLIERDWQL